MIKRGGGPGFLDESAHSALSEATSQAGASEPRDDPVSYLQPGKLRHPAGAER